MFCRIRLAILPGRSKLKIAKNLRNYLLLSLRVKRARPRSLHRRRKMTSPAQRARLAALRVKTSRKLSRRSTVLAKIRNASKDPVNKESKRTIWTKKEHPLIAQGTDSSPKDSTYLLHKKSSLSRNHPWNEWGSWRSNRIGKTTRTLKQRTRRVQTRHWLVQRLFHRPMIKKILLQKMKLPSRFCSHRLLRSKHRYKLRRRSSRMSLTSMISSTSTPTWSTTASSFAEKFSARLCSWRTSAARSKSSICPSQDSKSLIVTAFSANTIVKNCLSSTRTGRSSKIRRWSSTAGS